MAYLRHGLVLLYQKACQKASIRARFSHNFLFREGLRLILGKPPESGSARLGHIPSLPWEPQLPLKPCILLQPPDLKGNCGSSDSVLDFCCVSLCSSVICFANVGYSPTPRQHFCKTAAPKNFSIRLRRKIVFIRSFAHLSKILHIYQAFV